MVSYGLPPGLSLLDASNKIVDRDIVTEVSLGFVWSSYRDE
jgi:hypothetical protein